MHAIYYLTPDLSIPYSINTVNDVRHDIIPWTTRYYLIDDYTYFDGLAGTPRPLYTTALHDSFLIAKRVPHLLLSLVDWRLSVFRVSMYMITVERHLLY